ncbi:hypothetical protein GCM10027160_18630 [Streptomyces calidiresistens]|uniref:Uncharacterized protein n=1 Tax=Streptomyces calidiresistens TaxID=1485586 RepID=A0A7W3T388_9ACTN|nr:hypothetical protein [Streptomyces calidiresistens]MBB0230112.1 hypothetical protein [Streptomyces calidiresistens]
MDASDTGIRSVRAAVFAAMCLAPSIGAHVLLTGRPLPVGTVVGVALAVFVLAWLLAGRERGFLRIAALLVPLELSADALFTSGQAACFEEHGRAAGTALGGPLRLAGIDLMCAGGELGTPLARWAAGAETAVHPVAPWILLAAHVGIGLGAAAWLRCGEAALARLLAAAVAAGFRPLSLARTLLRAPLPADAGAPGPLTRTPFRVLPPTGRPAGDPVSRRGPPEVVPAA